MRPPRKKIIDVEDLGYWRDDYWYKDNGNDDEDEDGAVLEFSLDLDELTEEQVAEVAATEKSGSVPTYSLDLDEAADSPGMDDEIEDLIKSIDKPPVVDALDDPDQVMSSFSYQPAAGKT